MSGHTPGPWGIEFLGDGASILNREDQTDNWEICEVYHIDTPVGRANLSLLHAAPDLLEALEGMVFLAIDGDYPNGRSLKAARAAIARAKGEA